MTMEGREVKAYIYGVLASQGTLTGDPITMNDLPFYIGANIRPNRAGHSLRLPSIIMSYQRKSCLTK